MGSPASAQEQEIAVGGGFHWGVLPWATVPSTPTVDLRFTRWGTRWGVSGRLLTGFGGTAVNESTVYERSRPTYVQLLARFRRRSGVVFAIGGGLMGFDEQDQPHLGGESRFVWGGHLLAVEALAPWRVSDKLTLRVGVGAVVPVHVNPTIVLVWGR